jgi:hypothetical protein
MSLWKIIAKNELRLATYRFRKDRKLFFIILFSLAFFWAFYFGPTIFDILLSEFVGVSALENQFFFLDFIEYLLMTLFLLNFMIPLYNLYKKDDIGYIEMLLSSPAKPRDIFLGLFLWKMPLYILSVLSIGPVITSLISQFTNLNYFHYLIIYINMLILSILGLLVGKGVGNVLEHIIVKSERKSDKTKQIMYLSTIITVIFLYLLRYFFNWIFNNPALKNLLMFYPSFWYSNLILYSIDPSLISSYIINVWVSLILAIVFPILLFYIAYTRVNPTLNLEMVDNKDRQKYEIKKDYYAIIKKIIPHKWEVLFLTQFKVFFRKRENRTKVIYYIIFYFVMGFFISIDLQFPVLTQLMGEVDLISIKNLIILILAWMSSILFGILVGNNVFISSQNLLFLFKRSPGGVKLLIKSYLLVMLYLILFLDIIISIIFSLLFKFDIFNFILFFCTYLLYSGLILLQAVGFQCFNHLSKEGQRSSFFNSYLIVCFQFIIFFITLSIFIPSIQNSIEMFHGLFLIMQIQIFVAIPLTYFIFLLGVRKLETKE